MRKRGVKENVIETALVKRVEALGGVAEKVTVLGRRGFFDRLVVLPGNRVIFVECKRPKGGVMSPHQISRHRTYQTLGVVIVTLSTLSDIDHMLKT